MTYKSDWYDSGRLADDFSWPKSIPNEDHETILSYEKDWSWAGCSGYVTYEMGGVQVTIAFSNPSVGSNKLGVGTNGKGVWDDMDDQDYKQFVVPITINGETLNFNCKCTVAPQTMLPSPFLQRNEAASMLLGDLNNCCS